MKLLSHTTAVCWLQEKLLVENVEERFRLDKFRLINDIIRAYAREVAFQTVTMTSLPEKDRHVSTEAEIIENGLSLQGGVCLNLNYFMRRILEVLGYNAYTAGGSSFNRYSPTDRIPFNHVVTIVRDLKEDGDLYVVDVGCGYPTLHAIPLMNLPYTYNQCGLEIKYDKVGDLYVRMHRKGDFGTGNLFKPFMKEDWRLIFDFELTPRSLEFFTPYMHKTFTTGNFFEEIRLIRFPGPGENMLAIRGDIVCTYSEKEPEKGTQKRTPKDIDWHEFIAQYFPNLREKDVEKSLAHYYRTWRQTGN